MTRPPTASGIHISAPVRDRAPVVVLLAATLELLVKELEFELELEFEFELELWAPATPDSAKVMMNARNAPASNRRA